MPKLSAITPKKLSKVLEGLGFVHHHTVGSHRVFKHPDGRRTVIAFHSKDIPKGTVAGILNDVKISREEFLTLL